MRLAQRVAAASSMQTVRVSVAAPADVYLRLAKISAGTVMSKMLTVGEAAALAAQTEPAVHSRRTASVLTVKRAIAVRLNVMM